jgi:hypothetical protein
MIRELFATIYETLIGIYNSQFQLIFQTLYDFSGYIKLGLTVLVIPLLLWFLFYFFWHYPYGKFWHWILWLIIIAASVFGCTYGIANHDIFASNNPALNEALKASSSGYKEYASNLILTYAIVNSLLSVPIGFIYSLFLKQFSKIQLHLPF